MERIDFIVDQENKVISYNGLEWGSYKLYKSVYYVTEEVLTRTKTHVTSGHPAAVNKLFTKTFHITPSNFKKVFNAMMYALWVKPYKKDIHKYLTFSAGRITPKVVNKYHKVKTILDQNKKDGIENISPICFATGQTPQQLKTRVGKSAWKKICKNTFTRNLLIAKHMGSSTGNINILLETPSSILKQANSPYAKGARESLYAIRKAGFPLTHTFRHSADRNKVKLIQNIYADTERMSKQLEKAFNSDWSIGKLQAKHSEYADIIRKRKFSDEPFAVLDNITVKHLEFGEYTATLLTSALEIVQEGDAMHHCVSAYVDSVREGRYLVYSIKKDGVRSSTLGVFSPTKITGILGEKSKVWSYQQQYGVCNQPVAMVEETLIADMVIAELNKVQADE